MSQQDELWSPVSRAHADIDRMYQDILAPTRWVVARHMQTWRPPTDVYEIDEAIVVRVEIAGMKESDFGISLQGRLLTITGMRDDPRPKVAYHQMEIRYGEFRVEVYLHWAVDPEAVMAVYADGFLRVTLPRVQPRKLHPVELNT